MSEVPRPVGRRRNKATDHEREDGQIPQAARGGGILPRRHRTEVDSPQAEGWKTLLSCRAAGVGQGHPGDEGVNHTPYKKPQ